METKTPEQILNNKQKLIADKQKEKNAKFIALPQNKKAILVAKDVIAQIDAKKYEATCGTYFEADDLSLGNFKDSQSVQTILLSENAPACECCAIGSIMYSTIRNQNKVSVKALKYGSGGTFAKSKAKGIFSNHQLELIETAFEKEVIATHNKQLSTNSIFPTPTDLARKAIKFGKRFKNSNNRLKAIMVNIIENKGEFIP